MTIISFVSSKGGAGKSTLAANLAVALTELGEKVVVIDADEQGSLIQWAAIGADQGITLPMVVAAGDDVRRVALELGQTYPWVIVDVPGRHGVRLVGALGAADIALIPVRPAAFDAWSLRPVLDALSQVREVRGGEPAAYAVRNAWKKVRMAQAANDALEALDSIEIFPETIGDRAAIGEAIAYGQGAITYQRSSVAAIEVRRLATTLTEMVEGSPRQEAAYA